MTSFEACYRSVIIPVAKQLSLLEPANRNACKKGRGPYDDERTSYCYCLCYGPMHHASFKQALSDFFPERSALPTAPLVVDFGCGPSTALFALLDWLDERGMRCNSSYVGIDRSRWLLEIGDRLLKTRGKAPARIVLRDSIASLSDADLMKATMSCNGVIFALSYILHQGFMTDVTPLANLMSRVKHAAGDVPTWFLLQDANLHEEPSPGVHVWPETRMNELADQCSRFGYDLRVWKTKFRAAHVSVSRTGTFTTPDEGNTDNACYFFEQVQLR